MKQQDALEMIFARNAFYKRLHYLVLGAWTLSLIVIGVLVWTILYLLRDPVKPLYFATDNVGRLIQIIPVNVPNMTTDDVIRWAIEAVETSYSYDYINFRKQLQDAQKYYTSYGWTRYIHALTASNNLLAVNQRKMVAIAKVVDQPKILAEGILSGAYAWKFEMPVLVTYSLPPYDEKSKFYNPLKVTVILQRQQPLQGYKGLGIVQMIGALQTNNNQPQEISPNDTGE